MKPKRQHVEHEIQCSGIAACRTIPGCEWIHSIPNAMPGDIKAQMWMNREGRLPGVSDVFLPVCLRVKITDGVHIVNIEVIRFAGLYIEVKKPEMIVNGKKSPAGKLTEEQVRFILYADRAGYAVAVVFGVQPFVDTVVRYMKGEHSNAEALRMAGERFR